MRCYFYGLAHNNDRVFLYWASVIFVYGWISESKFLKFSYQDWIWICKSAKKFITSDEHMGASTNRSRRVVCFITRVRIFGHAPHDKTIKRSVPEPPPPARHGVVTHHRLAEISREVIAGKWSFVCFGENCCSLLCKPVIYKAAFTVQEKKQLLGTYLAKPGDIPLEVATHTLGDTGLVRETDGRKLKLFLLLPWSQQGNCSEK